MAKIIRQAEVVFIAGGDQGNYLRGWKGTPVQDAINANIAAGKPIGGTSAGLAVLGGEGQRDETLLLNRLRRIALWQPDL